MKVLIFGKNGQVAWELARSFGARCQVRSLGSEEVNFLNPDSVVQAIRDWKPTHIVNAAAYTAVDKAESEPKIANQVNGETVGIVASEARSLGAAFLHYSTDYVFSGRKEGAYLETDTPQPCNVYGQSKLLGEKYIQEVAGDYVILRVSWVYGGHGANFYKTMLRLGQERSEVRVVSDQVGTPTWSRYIAECSTQILSDTEFRDKVGLYHLSPMGKTSWAGFARKIFELNCQRPVGKGPVQVIDIPSKDYPTPAQRPMNSCMDASKVSNVFNLSRPEWDDCLRRVSEEGRP